MSVTQSVGNAVHFNADGDRGRRLNAWAGEGTMHATCSCGMASKSVADVGLGVNFNSKGGSAETTTNYVAKENACVENFVAASDSDNSEALETLTGVLVEGIDCRECSFCSKCHLLTKNEVLVSQDVLPRDRKEEADSQEGVPSPCGEDVECNSQVAKAEEADVLPGYETPSKGLFDPFAPAPEDLACAPKKRILRKSRLPLRRQLKFDSSDDSDGDQGSGSDDDDAEDAKIVEALNMSLMEIVINSQSVEDLPADRISPDEPKTPTAVPLLPGVEETCPGAPLRHAFKSRKIGMAICRKLDFAAEAV